MSTVVTCRGKNCNASSNNNYNHSVECLAEHEEACNPNGMYDSKHTPTPYRYTQLHQQPILVKSKDMGEWFHNSYWLFSGDKLIGEVNYNSQSRGYEGIDNTDEAKATIGFIVCACNAHDKLVEALQKTLGLLNLVKAAGLIDDQPIAVITDALREAGEGL